MWIGRFIRGDTLPLLVVCGDPKTGEAEQPGSQVYAHVYYVDSPIIIDSVPLTPIDKFSGRWVFGSQQLIDADYAPGCYTVVYSWSYGGVARVKLGTFRVMSETLGDADGSVLALQATFRPEARNLLYETQSGKLMRGRNPS